MRILGIISKDLAYLLIEYYSKPWIALAYDSSLVDKVISEAPAPGTKLASLIRLLKTLTPSSIALSISSSKF